MSINGIDNYCLLLDIQIPTYVWGIKLKEEKKV